MATISSSIVMNDRMTSVLSNIVSSVNTTIRAVQSLDATQVSPNVSTLQLANSQLKIAETELDKMTASADQVNKNLGKTPSIIDNIKGKIIGAGAVMAAAFSIKKIIDASDQNAQITARLNLISDDPEILKKQIYASANDARMAYTDTAASVAKLGLLAKDAFNNTDEIVQFTNLTGKAFKISGAGIQESSAAMHQLTQAMASGRLQGDEFVSVLENAPMVAQAIAKYVGASMGELKQMSSDGKITSDIIKAALFSAADDINAKFGTIPLTWSDIWTQMKSYAFMASDGILKKINELANTQTFQNMLNSAKQGFSVLVMVANVAFNTIVGFAKIVADNWSLIGPIILGVATALGVYGAIQAWTTLMTWGQVVADTALGIAMAAQNLATIALAFVTGGYTAAQTAANAAAWAFPGTWIAAAIIGIIVAVVALIVAVVKWGTSTGTVAGTIVGIMYWVGAAFYNVFAGIANGVIWLINVHIKGFNAISKGAATVASGFMNAFINAFLAINNFFVDMINGIMKGLDWVGQKIDAVAGTSFAGGGAFQLPKLVSKGVNIQAKEIPLMANVEYKNMGAAYDKGVAKGNAGMNKLSGGLDGLKDLTKGPDMPAGDNPAVGGGGGKGGGADPNGKRTADNTGKMANSMEITEEDLKYLRDVAEQEYINQFTTASISIDMANTNTINESSDLDTIISALVEKTKDAAQVIADGVY